MMYYTNNMKKLLFILVAIISTLPGQLLRAQYMNNNFHTPIIPPSPNAAGLGQYGDIPVSLYSGIAQIGVPLFEAQERSLSLPLSISYHASGIRVDQVPTWIGLGWVFNGGGVVTRNIIGGPDELIVNESYINAGLNPLNENAWDGVGTTMAGNSQAYNYFNQAKNFKDPSPDDFTFNIGGVEVGKFIFGRDGKAITTRKIRIEYELEQPNTSTKNFKNFTITLENGVKYFFTYREKSYTSSSFRPLPMPPGELVIDSSWYLTKISSPDGLSEINIEYVTTNLATSYANAFYTKNEKYYRAFPDQQSSCSGTFQRTEWLTRHSSDMVCISKISTSNYEIRFETSPNTANLYINRKLDRIIIFDKQQQKETKRFEFNYEPYGKKFLLSSLLEKADKEKVYRFEYNPTTMDFADNLLDNPDSYGTCRTADQGNTGGIDYFGYYNGPKPRYCTRLPRGQVGTQYLDGLDRTPNPYYVTAGILTKIIYPTKGYSEFDYEPNDYSYVNNTLTRTEKYNGGGVRIKTITNHDGISHANDVVKSYSYLSAANSSLSSGVITYEPHTAYFYEYYSPANSYNPGYRVFLQFSQPFRPMDIGYAQVTETTNNNGSTVYQFTTAKDYPDVPHVDDGTFAGHNTDMGGMIFSRLNHPFKRYPRMYGYMRGLMVSKKVLDAAGQTLEHLIKRYSPRPLGEVFASYITGVDFHSCIAELTTSNFFIHHFKVMVGRPDLIEEEVRIADHTNTSRVMVNVSTYEYSFKHLQLVHSNTTDSKGNTLITTYKYPLDYESQIVTTQPGETLPVLNLIKNNVVNAVVEKYVTRADELQQKVIAGEYTVYHPTLLRPTQTYSLSSMPSTAFTPAYIATGNVWVKDSRYLLQGNYTYDASGNISSIAKADGNPTSYLWGYNRTYPIAEVQNAAYNQIFYTSFETSGLEDATGAVTGRKYLNSGSYTIPFTPPADGRTYMLSYWYYQTDKWLYRERAFTGTITEGTRLDEIRVYPAGSLMNTYTYNALAQMTSQTDANGLCTYYVYDGLGRPQYIMDHQKNIIKSYVYQYKQ